MDNHFATQVPGVQVEEIIKIGKTPTETPDNDRVKLGLKFAQEQITIKEIVKHVLKYDKLARKDYWWLNTRVYALGGFIKQLVILENFSRKPSPETINRERRELYIEAKKGDPELKWLLTDEEFIENMKEREELFKNYFQDKRNSEEARFVK